jgi:alpha-L-rhamnosidase
MSNPRRIFSLPFPRRARLLALLAATALAGFPAMAGTMIPGDLRCELRYNPPGIGEGHPRLDWTLTPSNPDARGLSQSAYEIAVASSQEKLAAGQADLWDSGKVASNQTSQVVYGGRPLQSRAQCWWRVRVWDQAGQPSDWSAPAHWSMGLLDPADWKAEWIGLDKAAPADGSAFTDAEKNTLTHLPLAQPSIAGSSDAITIAVRRGFTLPQGRKLERIRFLGTADQVADLSLNGKKMAHFVRWEPHGPVDLTAAARPGDNVIGLEITQQDGRLPSLQGELEIAFADGWTVRLPVNETWHFSQSPPPGWDTAIQPREEDWRPMLAQPNNGLNVEQFSYLAPAPYLRREFTVTKPVRRATIYATALGDYEMHLNGARIGDDYFTPGWTDYTHRVPYETYDVTAMLHPGGNALGAILGSGWYAGIMGNAGGVHAYGGYPRFAAQLEIEYTDGTRDQVVTDGSWRGAFGPILYADNMEGCAWDGRRDFGNWAGTGFNAAAWLPVATGERRTEPGPAPKFVIQADSIAPIRVTDELPALTVTQPKPGVYVADFGQNHTGWVRLTVKGRPGQKITVRHGEGLNPNGTVFTSNLTAAVATDVYWLRGGGEEKLEPRFTFHGFRYAEITGLDAAPDPASITSVAASSLQDVTGEFDCSNGLLNQLFCNIVWTQKSDSFSTTLDCPNRSERLGWTGDAQLFLRTAAYDYDVAAFMERWLQSMRDGQSDDGLMRKVNPQRGPAEAMTGWSGDAAVICTDLLWRIYGDKRVIEENFDALKRYADYLALASQAGISSIPTGPADWLNAGGPLNREALDTAYYSYVCGMMSEMAGAIGRKADADRFAGLQKDSASAFEQAFVLPDGGIRGSSQTGYALAFTQAMIPGALRGKMADKFAGDIAAHGWHLDTGLIGAERLLPALHLAGKDDAAYRLLLQDTYPGWLFMVKSGATTMWEAWNGYVPGHGFLGNSLDHVALGSVGEFLYRYVAGIDTDTPGFRHILIQPQPGGGLTQARASYDAISGHIETEWKLSGATLSVDSVIPPNTTATIRIPVPRGTAVTDGHSPAEKTTGVKLASADSGGICYEVGSGHYHFEAPYPAALALAQTAALHSAPPPLRPVPTFANVSYGPHPHQIMDIYLPPHGHGPFPAVLWYNGIWRADKNVPPIDHFLPANVAAITVETKAMDDTMPLKMNPPISGVLLDGRRALQFVRLHAKEWNIDPNRLATAGGSQGTLVALYVGCSGEKANPASPDPVERTSSKVTCVGAWASQPSIDPKRMQQWVPGVEWGVPALGLSFADSLAKYDQILPVIKQWSPDWLINPNTPPIYFEYTLSLGSRPPDVPEMPYKVHSPLWAIGFKKLADAQGVTCYLRYPGHESAKYKSLWDFLVQMLTNPS